MSSELTQEPWANDPSPIQKRLCDPGLPRGRSDILALAFASPEVLWTVEEGGRFCTWHASNWGVSASSPAYFGSPLEKVPISRSTLRDERTIDLDDPGMLWSLEPDWNMGFSASGDLTAYELPTGKQLWTRECNSWITAIATGPGFGPNSSPGRPGVVLTGHDDGTVFLWDLSGPKRTIKRIPLGIGGPVAALAISPDGSKFAIAASDRTIVLVRRDGPVTFLSTPDQASSHKGPITALCWGGTNGDILFSASWDQTVRVWDVWESKPLILLNSHIGHVTAMAWVDPDTAESASAIHFVSADESGHLHSWEADHWSLLGVPWELADPVRMMAISPDRRLIAWADSARHIQMIRIEDLKKGSNAHLPDSIDPRSIRDDLFLDPHSRQLLHRQADGRVRFWHIQGGVEESSPTPDSSALVCSSDGHWIWLAQSGSHSWALDQYSSAQYSSDRGAESNSIGVPAQPPRSGDRILGFHRTIGSQWRLESVIETSLSSISTLALSDDGRELSMGSHLGPEVEIRRLPAGDPIALWGADWPGEVVQSISARTDGWVVGTLDPMATGGTPGHTWFVGPDGSKLGDCLPARILARHAQTGKIARIDHIGRLGIFDDGAFIQPPECTGPWQAIVFSPDGRYIAMGGERKISLYDLIRSKWIGSVETVSVVRAIIMDGGPSAIWAAFRCGECCLLSMSPWVEPEEAQSRSLET